MEPPPAPPPADPIPCISANELLRLETALAYEDLHRMAATLHQARKDDRREEMQDYVRTNRSRFLKSYVAIRWLSEFGHGELVENARQALTVAHSQRDKINECQDRLFFMHGGLFGARQRPYAVPAALDVLIGGAYQRLPTSISNCGKDKSSGEGLFPMPESEQEVISRIERGIRLVLVTREPLPAVYDIHEVKQGLLLLGVKDRFVLSLTVEQETLGAGGEKENPWQVRRVECTVRAREGEAVTVAALDARQSFYLRGMIQKAMDGAELPLQKAYDMMHVMCSGVHLAVLKAQAEALVESEGSWAGHLNIRYHAKEKVLDLSLWEQEFQTGVGGTGKGVGVTNDHHAEDAVHAQVNGVPPPTCCRYIRLYVDPSRGGSLMCRLGPSGGDGLVKGGDVAVAAGRVSCANTVLESAAAFTRARLQAVARQLRRGVEGASWASEVSVEVAGGVTVQVKPEAGGLLEVSLCLRTGRCAVSSGRAAAEQHQSGMTRLAQALNAEQCQDSHLVKSLRQVLGSLTTQAAEACLRGDLGLEPQRRWGALLRRRRRATSPWAGESTPPRQHATYVVVADCLERGCRMAQLERSAGTSPSSSSELVTCVLELAFTSTGALSATLLVASSPAGSKQLQPTLVAEHPVWEQPRGTEGGSSAKQLLGKRPRSKTEGASKEELTQGDSLRLALSRCCSMLPYARLQRAFAAIGLGPPEGGAAAVQAVVAPGTWVSWEVPEGWVGAPMHATKVEVLFVGSWRWRVELLPESLLVSTPWPTQHDGMPALLRSVSITAPSADGGPYLMSFTQPEDVPLHWMVTFLGVGLPKALTSIANLRGIDEFGPEGQSSKKGMGYQVTARSAVHIAFATPEGTYAVITHPSITLQDLESCGISLPTPQPLCLSVHLKGRKCPSVVARQLQKLFISTQCVKTAAQAITTVRRLVVLGCEMCNYACCEMRT
ncbi:unnamed protein product [Chrysoparadoxa australica]